MSGFSSRVPVQTIVVRCMLGLLLFAHFPAWAENGKAEPLIAAIRTRVTTLDPAHRTNRRIEALLSAVGDAMAACPQVELSDYHLEVIARTVARLSRKRSSAQEWASFARLYVRWTTEMFLRELPNEADMQVLRGQLGGFFDTIESGMKQQADRVQANEKQVQDAGRAFLGCRDEIIYMAGSYISGKVWQPLSPEDVNALQSKLAQDFAQGDSTLENVLAAMQHINSAFYPQLPAADMTTWPADVRQAHEDGTNADKARDEAERARHQDEMRRMFARNTLQPTIEGLQRLSLITDCLMIGSMLLDAQVVPLNR